jgi:nucleoside-diphosphate-sugar epimerase
MATLLCLGFGYCAEHFAAAFGQKFDRIFGTVRGAERAAILNAYDGGRLRALSFDGSNATAELHGAIGEADFALVSIPPGADGDTVLAACGAALAEAQHLRSIVYLSSIGVYGDHGGGWVDEQTPPLPASARSRERLLAERAWQDFGAAGGSAVAVLRLAGIYGPGQNALVSLAAGKARRIIKPGQFFNRIHVADIARSIDAAFARAASGIFNVADDEPTPPADPFVFAAHLMGVAPPPEIPFAEVAPSMSPMALSFWQECRRANNEKLKRELGVALRYPTYREGLKALFDGQ